jgi:stage IV sporulation protein FB
MVGLGGGRLWAGQLVGVNLAVAGAFRYLAAGKERYSSAFLILTEMARKKETLLKKGQMPLRQIMAHRDTPVETVARGFTPGRYHQVVVVDNDLRPLGRISELRLLESLLLAGGGAPLGSLLRD